MECSSEPRARSWLFRQEKSDRRALLQDSEVSKSMCVHPDSHASNITQAHTLVNRGSAPNLYTCRVSVQLPTPLTFSIKVYTLNGEGECSVME